LKQALYIFIIVLFITGCKKKDESPPVFSILGDSLVVLNLNTSYIDSGVIVKDNKSGFFLDTVNTVITDKIGQYIIKYVAVDDEGNIGSFTRIVKVIVTPDDLVGRYSVAETVTEGPNAGDYKYTLTVAKNSSNNGLLMSFFGGWGDTAVVNTTITEYGEIEIPQQDFQEGTLSGSGTINENAKAFTIDYTYNYSEGTDVSNFTAWIIKNKK